MRLSGEGILADWVGSEQARLDKEMWDQSLNSVETLEGGLVRLWQVLDPGSF